MRFASQDWHSSPLRGELAVERDHLSRMVYLELLLWIHAFGPLRRDDLSGTVLLRRDDAERALGRLVLSGAIVEVDGLLTLPDPPPVLYPVGASNRRLLLLIRRDGPRCRACGADQRLSVDHRVPRARGGTDDPENLQILCVPCNSSKGARPADEWEGRH